MSFPTPDHVKAAQTSAKQLWSETSFYIWPSVTLAQADIESAGWTKLAAANNGFGIKATQAQIARGDARLSWTHETLHGKYVRIPQWFASFASLEDAYYAHARLLATSGYYVKARHEHSPIAFARDLTGIYATGIPGHPYGDVLVEVMTSLKLFQWDEKMPEAQA